MLDYGLLNEYECCTYGYSHEYEYTHECSTGLALMLKPQARRALRVSALAAKFGIVALLDFLDGRHEL